MYKSTRTSTKCTGHAGHVRLQAGISMLEIVIVLVLVGILATAAIHTVDTQEINYYAEVDNLQNALRYAQLLAMGDQEVWNINIKNSEYELQRNCATQDPEGRLVRLPGQGSVVYAIPNGISMFGSQNIAFNSRGQPSGCDGVALAGDVVVTVDTSKLPSGTKLGDFTITANTGFIQ
ncbi:MAG: type II secretion system GspH family protein [Desulfovibrio sp.]|nr:type II secretion system GspH family protein [Desulfovibrio sp.]